MKTWIYSALVLLWSAQAFAASVENSEGRMNGRYTKEKVINKSYDVNSTALFKVNNSYGTVTLSSWNEDRIQIEVRITTNGNDEEKVEKRLTEIDVIFETGSDMVSARTDFGHSSVSWNWGKRNQVNVQVDYLVKLPVKHSIDLSNDYGKIVVDRVDGHAKISCDYGTIEVGELRGRQNELRFDYTSKCQFGYINSALIKADYSSFRVNRAEGLEISADYTQSVVEKVKTLTYNSDYGSLEANEVGDVQGNGDYIGVKLGKVSGNLNINADYGSIKIEELTASAGNVSIGTDFTSIKIGLNPDYHFDFEIQTEYAGVSGKEAFEVQISKEKSTERYYKGFHGSSGSGRLLTIRSEYGGITFNQL